MTKRQTRPETLHQKIIVGILVRSLLFYYFSLELSHFQYYEPIEEIVENQTIAPILGYYGRRLCQSNGLQFCLSNHPIRVDLLHSDCIICWSNTSIMAPRQLPYITIFYLIVFAFQGHCQKFGEAKLAHNLVSEKMSLS